MVEMYINVIPVSDLKVSTTKRKKNMCDGSLPSDVHQDFTCGESQSASDRSAEKNATNLTSKFRL